MLDQLETSPDDQTIRRLLEDGYDPSTRQFGHIVAIERGMAAESRKELERGDD